MTRASRGSGALAVRWPVPVGALAAGCGLALLVYQAGAVPLPAHHSTPSAAGPVARLRAPAAAEAPPRTVLRPVDVTQQLLVAVQLAPAAFPAATQVSSPVTHVVAASHHTVLVALGSHPGTTDLLTGTGSPVSGTTTTPLDPGTPVLPGTTDTGTGTVTEPGTTGTGTDAGTDPGTDPGTGTGPAGTGTDPGTGSDPSGTGTDPTGTGATGTDTGSGTTGTGTGTGTDPTGTGTGTDPTGTDATGTDPTGTGTTGTGTTTTDDTPATDTTLPAA